MTSAYKPSVGRNRMAKSVENGGTIYFSAIVLASLLTARSSSRPAVSTASASARSAASCSRSYCSFGNFASTGNQTASASSLRPGRRIANSTRSPLPRRTSTFLAYCAGVSICSRIISSCTSPHVPRVFTLVRTFFRSPTPVASCCISPSP